MVRGNKCAFHNCGRSRREDPSLQQYRFPNDESLSRQWVINSGNVLLLDLSPKSLNKKHVVCSRHFEEHDFVNAALKHRLRKGTIPKPFDSTPNYQRPSTPSSIPSTSAVLARPSISERDDDDDIPLILPKKTYTRCELKGRELFAEKSSVGSPVTSSAISPSTSKWLDDIANMPYPSSNKGKRKIIVDEDTPDTPKKKKLKMTVEHQRRLLKNKRSIIARLRNKLKLRNQDATLTSLIGNVKFVSKSSQVLTRMQILRKRRAQWLPEERTFALQLFYRSPSAYKFLRKKQGIVLPSLSTIRKWIGDSKFKPGFSPKLLLNIKRKVETMDEEAKECTLVFDEMKIKKNLDYSKLLDFIEGFEDLGPLGRSPAFGTQVMLFMLRGLYSSWKMPLAYFICSSSMKNADLKKLLLMAIEKVFFVRLKIRAIICDQGTNNQATLKNLGVTDENPYFFFNENKIFAIFDIPHLFKNWRNHWLQHDFEFCGLQVSFSDVRRAFEIDRRSSTGRSLMKITERHINPGPFQKMNCALALQIFSRSMAAAIRTAVATGQLDSPTALNTALFIDFFNDLFDCMNSKQKYARNPYSCAISKDRPLIAETIEEGRRKIETTFKITPKGLEKPPCFRGLQRSLNATLSLYREQEQRGFPFLLTYRLNQDVVENSFSIYRHKGGFNPNPTVRGFRSTFRIQAKMNLMHPSELTNCEDDTDIHLFSAIEEDSSKLSLGKISSKPDVEVASHNSDMTTSSSSTHSGTEKEESQSVLLEDCSNAYFAGYLIKSCLDKYKCENCEAKLSENENMTDKKQLLIIHKTYKTGHLPFGLRKPSTELVELVKKSLTIIQKELDKNPHMTIIAKRLQRKIMKRTEAASFITNENCVEHMEFLIKKMITAKIFKECKWRSMSERPKGKMQKLDILKSL